MTIYVDNFRIPYRGSCYSHLTADTEAELHEFAEKLGLQRRWYQARCKSKACTRCIHWHYDISDAKRNKAIELGAKPLTLTEMSHFLTARRAAYNLAHPKPQATQGGGA
jgi:hypothetical protein